MNTDSSLGREQLRIVYDYSVRYLQTERGRLERMNSRIATMITLHGILFGFVVFVLQQIGNTEGNCVRVVTIGLSLLTLITLGLALFFLLTSYLDDKLEAEMSSSDLVDVCEGDSSLTEEDLLKKLSFQLATAGDNYRELTERRSRRIRTANVCFLVALVLIAVVGTLIAVSELEYPESKFSYGSTYSGVNYFIEEANNPMFFFNHPEDKEKSNDEKSNTKKGSWKDNRFKGKIVTGEQKDLDILPDVSGEDK